ncbi:hypothetical protein SAY86_005330 [Trapa natans]|uniref:FPL domain-containing protein n=1 Tax=Trapa natans TaxID=22666 RepID=A0AAN7QSD6_TRANT|nr:hypothetical protein SAY86_005330 [Trapa natans]
MWRSLWRSIDRFSPQYFKYLLNELREIKVVDRSNREFAIDILQSVVEVVTYGDKHDPMIFEYFMEYQVMAEFLRILKISKKSRIEGPLLQYLSIMIQNIESDHAIYYCFSNGYINSIIMHSFTFEEGDLASYYVSFLRAVSSKVNRDTLCLLVRIEREDVVSFPLYSEALKFAQHGEKMIQTAVRALTLNIYNVSDELVYHFITTPPVSKYFSDLMQNIREQCLHVDSILQAEEETFPYGRTKKLHAETEKVVDDLYYLKDLLSVGESQLSRSVLQNLLSFLVLPVFLPLPQLENSGSSPSIVTSLYIVSRLIQIISGKSLINLVTTVMLYPYIELDMKNFTRANGADESGNADSFASYVSQLGGFVFTNPEVLGSETMSGSKYIEILMSCTSLDDGSMSIVEDDQCTKRGGILSYILSDNPCVMLASLFLLFILMDSKDLHYMFVRIIESHVMVEAKLIDALLKVFISRSEGSVQMQLETGWLFRNMLALKMLHLNDGAIILFKTSYQQSHEQFQKELDGCWFDYIPDTLKDEWESCRKALGDSSYKKDPVFALELAIHQQRNNGYTGSSSSVAWQKMVDAVKVYILHIHLKAFILKLDLPGKPIPDLADGPAESGTQRASDHWSANFGSEIPLGSAFPCRIAFSNAGIRDIYVIPVARGKSGKLLLMEKHPFRTQRGVVIAIAPLAGLCPKIDDDHPTWLHLQIREFDKKSKVGRTEACLSKKTNQVSDGRWTLGFPNAETCMTARAMIVDERTKQRSFVEKQISPLHQYDTIELLADN